MRIWSVLFVLLLEFGMAVLFGALAYAAPDGVAPAFRQYGAIDGPSRITLRAEGDCWVRVREADNSILFLRIMHKGDTYRAPDRRGLMLDTGSTRMLKVEVDGKPVRPLTTTSGAIRYDIALNPDDLTGKPLQRTSVLPVKVEPVADAPAIIKAVATAPVPVSVPVAEKPMPVDDQPAAMPASEPAVTKLATIVPDVRSLPAPVVEKKSPVKPDSMVNRVALQVPPSNATPASAIVPGIGTMTAPLKLEVSKGTLLRLPRAATTVFVADPEIADIQVRSPSLIYVLAKQAGETVLYAVDGQDHVMVGATLTVSHNISRLQQALHASMPNVDIDAESVDGAIVLSGYVPNASAAEEARRLAQRFSPKENGVVNQLRVAAPNQVSLRVRIAEVQRSTVKELGFNWDALFAGGSFALGIATGKPPVSGTSFIARNLAADGTSTTNSLVGGFTAGKFGLNGVIDALASEGLLTILAEPNLTAVSGETASFLAGGEFPVPVPVSRDTIGIDFKKFGVSLAFTPTLLDGDRINLKVRPEVSQLSAAGAININNITVSALSTRRAETTVELASGQSFAIAGLLQNSSNQDLSRVPGLGDLPVLGPLFRSTRFNRNESELVIIVTPYIVRPVSTKLAAPTDGLVPPNDMERIIGGVNYRQQMANPSDTPRNRQGQGLIGPAGFILE